jgi:hypothetical protein
MMEQYDQLAPESKVWIYQINRTLSEEETRQMNEHLQQFASQWVSHNRSLQAFARVYHQRFVVLMVDETQAGASGCSIDASVHFLKTLEATFQIHLFDRTTFLYLDEKGTIQQASMTEFQEAYNQGTINDNTLVFDNLVATKNAFEQDWKKPVAKSWHRRFVG